MDDKIDTNAPARCLLAAKGETDRYLEVPEPSYALYLPSVPMYCSQAGCGGEGGSRRISAPYAFRICLDAKDSRLLLKNTAVYTSMDSTVISNSLMYVKRERDNSGDTTCPAYFN